MSGKNWQKKNLPDGTPNPKFTKHSGPKKHENKFNEDGTPNPKYKNPSPRPYERKLLEDGTPNPKFRPDSRPKPYIPAGQPGHRPGGRSKYEKAIHRAFVAWDGEGCAGHRHIPYEAWPDHTGPGPHRYMLMCNSEGDTAWSESGLTLREVLDFLLDHSDPDKHHVAFSIPYDINTMLRREGFCLEDVQALWMQREGPTVVWQPCDEVWYDIRYVHRKKFLVKRSLHPHFETDKKGDYKRVYDKTFSMDDAFGFFQEGLVSSLERYLPEFSDLDLISRGKQLRGMVRDRSTLASYCHAECRALVALMEYPRRTALDLEIEVVKEWTGSGALASAMLAQRKTSDHIMNWEDFSDPLRDALKTAYSGGRMEAIRFGRYRGTVYNYDLSSAYAAAMTQLPSMAEGEWEHITDAHEVAQLLHHEPLLTMYRVTWDFHATTRGYILPFFWRESSGAIRYPPRGAGWYWAPDVHAALSALGARKLQGQVRVHEAWCWKPDVNFLPFDFLRGLYRTRQEWEAAGDPRSRILKLTLASFYGKTVQKTGGQKSSRELRRVRALRDMGIDETPRKHSPTYYCLPYGGWVCARVRQQLYEACMLDEGSVILMSTDGLYCRRPLVDLQLGTGMGAWRLKTYDGGIFVNSGLFWCTDKNGEVATHKRRALDAGSVTPETFIEAWKSGKGSVDAALTRFVGMGSVVHDPGLWSKWCSWVEHPRAVRTGAEGKRLLHSKYFKDSLKDYDEIMRGLRADRRLIDTEPAQGDALNTLELSSPYAVHWLDEAYDEATVDGVPLNVAEDEANF